MKKYFYKFHGILIAIFFLGNLVIVKAQSGKDSIANVIKKIRASKLDTTQVVKLIELGGKLTEFDSTLSFQLINEGLTKGIILKEKHTLSYCYRALGVWYSTFNKRDNALANYQVSLSIAKSINDLFNIAGTSYNIGNIKYWKGEYDSSIYYYRQAQNYLENPKLLEDKQISPGLLDRRKAELYGNISTLFNTTQNIKKADEYIDKAIAITKKYKSQKALEGLAVFMQQKADNFKDNGDEETALRIRLQYLPALEKAELKYHTAFAYQNIALAYLNFNKVDSSEIFAKKGLAISTKIKQEECIAGSNFVLADIALIRKQYDLAQAFAQKASVFYENTEDPYAKSTYYNLMHRLSFAQGKFKNAYNYFEQYDELKDSLQKGEAAQSASEREIRYETEKKEAQIKLQQATISQKNTLNYILIGGAAALLIILSLGYRNYTHRQKLQQQRIAELETQQQLTATEAVLKGEAQERTRLAKDLHDGLGGMLSGIKFSLNTMKGNLIMTPENAQAFERSIDMLDSSIQEMRRVAHNMMPEALVKFGLDTALKDFCLHISQSGALKATYQSIGLAELQLEQTVALTIYRIVQELINNTMKHAAAQTAIVQLSVTNHTLSVTVEDDGKGFDTTALRQSQGIGWNNIQTRINFLNGRLDIQSANNKGTSVLIELPLS